MTLDISLLPLGISDVPPGDFRALGLMLAELRALAERPREAQRAAQTLQSGGEYWNTLPYGAMPTSLAPPVRRAASLADPVGGPSGDRFNLPTPGAAGAWCRPPPVPIAETSPLSNQNFWIPTLLVAFGVGVFWLSRGLEMPP
jgi:hypothetical protein